MNTNICIQCSKPNLDGFARCFDCRIANNEAAKKVRANREKNGLCKKCGKVRETKEIKLCLDCREKSVKEHSQKKKFAIENNICVLCLKEKCLQPLQGTTYPRCEICYYKDIARSNGFKTSDWQYLKTKLINQKFRCPYTNELLVLGLNTSIDHIKPKSRFPEYYNDLNNVEWTTLTINRIKLNFTKEEFLNIISLVYKNSNG